MADLFEIDVFPAVTAEQGMEMLHEELPALFMQYRRELGIPDSGKPE